MTWRRAVAAVAAAARAARGGAREGERARARGLWGSSRAFATTPTAAPRATAATATSALGRAGFASSTSFAGRGVAGTSSGVPARRGYAGVAGEGMKAYKPTSPGQRGRITTSRKMLWPGRPLKALTVGLKKTGGRNNAGRVTVWHRGGGHKRLYRMIDFKRDLTGVMGTIRRLEYDPNRSTHIALVDFEDGHKPRYVLAPHGAQPGDTLESGAESDIKVGNALPLKNIPLQTTIHNIELYPGRGGQLCRSAGSAATLIKKGDDGYCVVRLPSGEQRLVLEKCMATIGMLSNRGHQNRNIGKAGANRWRGIRPTTRGVAMNPIDHPHGGGEGRTSGGRPSVTPWGKHTKGARTRNNKRTDAFRVSRRPRNRKRYKDNN